MSGTRTRKADLISAAAGSLHQTDPPCVRSRDPRLAVLSSFQNALGNVLKWSLLQLPEIHQQWTRHVGISAEPLFPDLTLEAFCRRRVRFQEADTRRRSRRSSRVMACAVPLRTPRPLPPSLSLLQSPVNIRLSSPRSSNMQSNVYSKFWPRGGLPGILHHYVRKLVALSPPP